MTRGGSRAVATVALAAVLVVVMVGGTLASQAVGVVPAGIGFAVVVAVAVLAAGAQVGRRQAREGVTVS